MYVKYNDDLTVNKFPYTMEDLYAEYPLTYFGPHVSNETLAAYNVAHVVMTSGVYNPMTEAADMSGCAYNAERGRWETTWTIRQLTSEQIQANMARAARDLEQNVVEAVQSRLDSFARTRNYDGILSACTYVTSAIPKFQQEAQYCVEARDSTWAKLYEIMADIQSGNRAMPSGFEDLEPELPILQWPA